MTIPKKISASSRNKPKSISLLLSLSEEESQEILVKLELRDGFVHSVCGRFT